MGRNKKEEKDKKSKINLNINENLLDKFDKVIKEEKRSKVIEKLLLDYIEENKDKL